MFGALAEAFAWLGRPDTAAVQAQVAEVIDRETGIDTEARALRGWLDRNLLDPTIERAAAELATSPRTLQRRLAEAGTTSRDEAQRARINAARRRLATTDDKVEAIARAVGFSASSHLARAFQAVTQETPVAFRARHR